MSSRPVLLTAAVTALVLAGLGAALPRSQAQSAAVLLAPAEAEAELARAAREGQRAAARAEGFTREAEAATEAATRTAREAAALAARIQQAEAEIAAARARWSLAQSARAALTARLAQKQEPTARLTAALQTAARRPLTLSALQPGSLKDVVHVRAVLASAVPTIRARTEDLRADLARGRALEARAGQALAALGDSEQALRDRRQSLAALETRQRIASRAARGNAQREQTRALALAEEARDLDGLVDRLGAIATLRAELAALPGPVPRPADLAAAQTYEMPAELPAPAAPRTIPPPRDFQLPVDGRTLLGFGAQRDSGLASTGLTLLPQPGAQVVAPGRGRVAFAGAYRGFGTIVIIEHAGGWTSLVTGMSRVDVAVGDSVIGGSPVGVAGGRQQPVTIELRQGANPVNPLQYLR